MLPAMIQEQASVEQALSWSDLGAQFCLQLAFGVLIALAFVPRAPVGAFFYRLMGSTALAPLLVAIALSMSGARPAAWNDPALLLTGVAVLAYPLYAANPRGARWWIGLGIAGCATAGAVAFTLHRTLGLTAPLELGLATLSALSTGAVAGSVGLAMVLGHWYLTVPKLSVEHLVRLNRVTVGAMLASLFFLALTCFAFREQLDAARTPLLGPWGLMYLSTRAAFGIFMPLLFAWMTSGALRFANTRSATGILYASTVLVLIGTAVAVSLQNSYGVPL